MADSQNNVKRRRRSITVRETFFGILVIFFVVLLTMMDIFNNIEWKAYDLRFLLREQFYEWFGDSSIFTERKEVFPRDRILIVGIDDDTGVKLPNITRLHHARVVENLLSRGARVVGCDVLYTRENPADHYFADIIRRYGNVILGCRAVTEKIAGGAIRESMIFPYSTILQAGPGLGLVDVAPDMDEIVRSIPLFYSGSGIRDENDRARPMPSLSMACVAKYLGIWNDFESLLRENKRKIDSGENSFSLGKIKIPVSKYSALINYQGFAGTFHSESFFKILNIEDLDRECLTPRFSICGGKMMFGKKKLDEGVSLVLRKNGTGSIEGKILGARPENSTLIIHAFNAPGRVHASREITGETYRIEGLRDGVYNLVLMVTGQGAGAGSTTFQSHSSVRVMEGEKTTGVDFVLPAIDSTLEGEILNTDRLRFPLENARVELKSTRTVVTATTGRDGRFEFRGLPTGPACITAEKKYYYQEENDEGELETVEDALRLLKPLYVYFARNESDENSISMDVSCEGGTVRGKVRGLPEERLKASQILLVEVDPDLNPLAAMDMARLCPVMADGSFQSDQIFKDSVLFVKLNYPCGDGRRELFLKSAIAVDIKPKAHTEKYFTISFESQGEDYIRGIVKDEKGAPAEGVTVSVIFNKLLSTAYVSPVKRDGRVYFSLPPLPSGEYYIFTMFERETGEIKNPCGSLNKVLLRSGLNNRLEVDGSSIDGVTGIAGRICGTVTDDEGRPVAGATVRLHSADGSVAVRTAKTDEKGEYLFSGVRDGDYILSAVLLDSAGVELMRGLGRPSRDLIEGKIVLIGSMTRSEHDIRATPFNFNPFDSCDPRRNQRMYGVEIHANVIYTILNNIGISRLGDYSRLGILLTMCFLTLLWMQRHTYAGGLVRVLLIIITYSFVATVMFTKYRIIMDMFKPVFGVAAVYIYSVSYRYVMTQKEKARIRGLFERFVPKDVVADLAENADVDFAVGGKREELTIMFTDIRGFTSMSEKMEPEQVVAILNDYLAEMVAIIFKHGGTLDKFIGDAIMAIFGAPRKLPDPAMAAVRVALEMTEATKRLRKKWEETGMVTTSTGEIIKVGTGIGINTGPCVVGFMGSKDRVDYTVIGDNVNLAARLEAAAARDQVLISESTFNLVRDRIIWKKMPRLKAKGKAEPLFVAWVKGIKEPGMSQEEIQRIIDDDGDFQLSAGGKGSWVAEDVIALENEKRARQGLPPLPPDYFSSDSH